MGWDLQSLVFPGRIVPAHTQRLRAPQGAAPGHAHSDSECPKDMALGNRTCIHLEAAGRSQLGRPAAHRRCRKPKAVTSGGTEPGKQKVWLKEGA